MAEKRLGVGKIIGIVVLVVGLAGILCCGGAYFFLRHSFETTANVQGSGIVISAERTVDAPFEGVSVQTQSAVAVHISIGLAPSITVEGDDNVVPILTTRVEDGVLVIGSLDTFSSDSAAITIVMPACASVDLDGLAEIHVTGLSAGAFSVSLAGKGKVTAAGSVDEVDVSLAGMGAVDVGALEARSAKVRLDGWGQVRVQATEALDAGLDGKGSIEYEGDPERVTTKVSGWGSIEAR